MTEDLEEPFPGYRFDDAASRRADAAQRAARAAILALDGGSLFDTEPDHLIKALNRLKGSAG